jgi:hypothetical protein
MAADRKNSFGRGKNDENMPALQVGTRDRRPSRRRGTGARWKNAARLAILPLRRHPSEVPAALPAGSALTAETIA